MIVDSGIFIAAANDAEPHFESCAVLLQTATSRLVVPALVIAEATYLIERAGGARRSRRF